MLPFHVILTINGIDTQRTASMFYSRKEAEEFARVAFELKDDCTCAKVFKSRASIQEPEKLLTTISI